MIFKHSHTFAVAIEPNLNAFSLTRLAPNDSKFQPEDKEERVVSKAISDC